jgi:hypothetical protein
MSKQWQKVSPQDEYMETSEDEYFQNRKFLVYWNPSTLRLRRYGVDGSFQEIDLTKKPKSSSGRLDLLCNMAFYNAAKRGQGTFY